MSARESRSCLNGCISQADHVAKHVLNEPANLVVDSLKGLVVLNPNIKLDEAQRGESVLPEDPFSIREEAPVFVIELNSCSLVIYKPQSSTGRVALLSGGGSGHEPAHAGFVGQGLLDAAVCGNIFASPNVAQIKRGLDLVTKGDKGALMVVMNYTGDALHFGLAAETFRSSGRGDARVVMVGDDVAVGKKQGSIVGRRYVLPAGSPNTRYSLCRERAVTNVLEVSQERSWFTNSLLRYLMLEEIWIRSKRLQSTLVRDWVHWESVWSIAM